MEPSESSIKASLTPEEQALIFKKPHKLAGGEAVASNERQEDKPAQNIFLDSADFILDGADDQEHSPEDTKEFIQAFVKSVEDAVEKGRIQKSSGEVYTINELHEALDLYVDWAEKDNDSHDPLEAFRVVTKTNKLRTAFRELALNPLTQPLFQEVLAQNKASRDKNKQPHAVPVPEGDGLRALMGAEQAQAMVEGDPAATLELQPNKKADIIEDMSEDVLELTVEGAAEYNEIQENEKPIPEQDLRDVDLNIHDLLSSLATTRHSDFESAEAYRKQTVSSALIERLNGKIRQKERGDHEHSKKTLAYELGAYLGMADNPNVIAKLMEDAVKGKLLSEGDLKNVEETIAALARNVTATQDQAGFNSAVHRYDALLGASEDARKLTVLDIALRGASVGMYTHINDDAALSAAIRLHQQNIRDLQKLVS